jgi:pimeloyl-ACP methyl ester carboxylesterase
MFSYDPLAILPRIPAPVIALSAADDETRSRARALSRVSDARVAAGHAPIPVVTFPHEGHNLMRYRPAAVSAALLSLGTLAGPAGR